MPKHPKFQVSIKFWLLAMIALAVAPMLVYASYSVYKLGKQYQDYVLGNLDRRGDSTARAVGERVKLTVSALNALAISEEATSGDLPALYRNAVRLTQIDPNFRAITLINEQDQMVFFTLSAFGASLPEVGQVTMHRRILETGKPAVSGPFKSPISDRFVAAVGVPIFHEGKVAYGLRMILLTDSLNRLLEDQKLPPDWIAAIVASDGRLLARTRQPNEFVGQPVVPGLQAAIASGERRSFSGTTKEGIETQTVIYPVPGTDWSMVVGVPTESLYGPLKRQMQRVYALGFVLLLLTIASAYLFSRVIHKDIRGLVNVGRALRRGWDEGNRRYWISELEVAAASLSDMRKREQGAQVALVAARNDNLTGLSGRASFEESMLRLANQIRSTVDGRLALFFIDIDNFKQVNDTLGHARGDQVLQQVAAVLRGVVREDDVVARLGGDEFAICITGLSDLESSARDTASRIVELVHGIGHGVGSSVGVVLCDGSCPDLSHLLSLADQAMYKAKRSGKNRYVLIQVSASAGVDAILQDLSPVAPR